VPQLPFIDLLRLLLDDFFLDPFLDPFLDDLRFLPADFLDLRLLRDDFFLDDLRFLPADFLDLRLLRDDFFFR